MTLEERYDDLLSDRNRRDATNTFALKPGVSFRRRPPYYRTSGTSLERAGMSIIPSISSD
jgi:hypothetical protein